MEVEDEHRPFPLEEEKNIDPKVFRTARSLTNTEVSILLGRYLDSERKHNPEFQPPPMVAKAQAYVDRLATGKNEDAAMKIRELLHGFRLLDYEIGLIANLAPETADEAMMMVPSLKDPERWGGRDPAAEIDGMLQELSRYARYD